MTTTTSNFFVRMEASALATRSAGRALCERLMERLKQEQSVTVDFDGVTVTPSFADEFLGVALESLGRNVFRERITLVNIADSAKPLVRHVLNQRAHHAASQVVAR